MIEICRFYRILSLFISDDAQVNKNTMSPTEILAGDVIEEALKSEYGDSINNSTSPSKKGIIVQCGIGQYSIVCIVQCVVHMHIQ